MKGFRVIVLVAGTLPVMVPASAQIAVKTFEPSPQKAQRALRVEALVHHTGAMFNPRMVPPGIAGTYDPVTRTFTPAASRTVKPAGSGLSPAVTTKAISGQYNVTINVTGAKPQDTIACQVQLVLTDKDASADFFDGVRDEYDGATPRFAASGSGVAKVPFTFLYPSNQTPLGYVVAICSDLTSGGSGSGSDATMENFFSTNEITNGTSSISLTVAL